MITLASNKATTAPKAFVVEVSSDGKTWIKADERIGIKWEFDNYVQSFSIPEEVRGAYKNYRVTLLAGSELAEIEFLGEKNTKSLVGFAGYQVGNDGKSIRLVGYADSLAYDSVDLEVAVSGDASKNLGSPTSTVFKTLFGTVDGKKTAVVSTLKDVGALVTLDHDNLYGMSIVNIPDGNYKFTITPTAKLGDTVVNGESVTLQITVSGGVITVTK
jgi:hypothetical protein